MIFNWFKERKKKKDQAAFEKEYRRISKAFREIESRTKVISESETQKIIEYEVPQFSRGEIYSVKQRLVLNYEPIYLNNEQVISETSRKENKN